jgi:hypothetical protein
MFLLFMRPDIACPMPETVLRSSLGSLHCPR